MSRRAQQTINSAGRRRREWLARGGLYAALLGCGLAAGSRGAAAADAGFASTTLQDALRALGGVPLADAGIVLDLPDVAEDGAVVPVAVTWTVPGASEVAIVVEGNPNPLVARYTIPDGTEPFVATHIKMAGSSRVYAVVQAGGRLYCAARETKVTVGGCG
jgi:sulfur-oxidizing protein SoxY